MRPRYETKRDGENNIRVMRAFAAKIPATTSRNVEPMPKGIDYDGKVQIDGKLACIVEVKGRTGSGDRFETWHVAKDKLDRCLDHANAFGVPFILLFSWDSDIYYWSVPQDISKLEVRSGGRYDRGDQFDIEPMAHIPRKLFKKI